MKLTYRVMDEEGGGDGLEGGAGGGPEGEAPAPWLRDLTEDDGYSILSSAREFPNHMRNLESRVFGSMGPVQERLKALEEASGRRVNFKADALKRLDEYEPSGKLSAILAEILPQVFELPAAFDEGSLRPHLDKFKSTINQDFGSQLVTAFFSPKELDEILPAVENGAFAPKGQRQQDFVDWYSQQDYTTQQSLQTLDAKYVRAMNQFLEWEKSKVEERAGAAQDKAARLAGGKQPSASGRRAQAATGPQNRQEAVQAGFDEVFAELNRKR